MIFRLATGMDLPHLKKMYQEIVENMRQHNINIWDEIYPCEFLEADIKNETLYILINESGDILSALALCKTNVGEKYITWEDTKGKAYYIDRLGVNVKYERKGIASCMLSYAKQKAKQEEISYLRLFVVDTNEPAISLYQKVGFLKKEGIFKEKIEEKIILKEYGFELKLNK